MKTWRERCAPIIAEVLERTKGQSKKEIRKALIEAYPFGERENYPYKVWLDEIKEQRTTRRRDARHRRKQYELEVKTLNLFE